MLSQRSDQREEFPVPLLFGCLRKHRMLQAALFQVLCTSHAELSLKCICGLYLCQPITGNLHEKKGNLSEVRTMGMGHFILTTSL